MLLKCCIQHVSKFGKQQWPQDWKRSLLIPFPKKGNAKECSNYHTIALISHASKIILKILQASLQQYVNWELPDVQTESRIGRGTRDQIANVCCITEKAGEFQKNIYFGFTDFVKAFDCINHNKLWKILKDMSIRPHLTCLLRNLYMGQDTTVRSGHELLTGSKLGKQYNKAVYCYLAYLIYMQSESEVTQSCLTLYDPLDCSLPGSSIHGILQARILEWVATSFSRVHHVKCWTGWITSRTQDWWEKYQ